MRVPATDENTDFYTVPLTQETLRPGTVYADPYGHVMMLVRRVPEAGGSAGVFYSVDGEPDGTVARKRFGAATFCSRTSPSLGSPGFKRFRPIVRAENGALRRLSAVLIFAAVRGVAVQFLTDGDSERLRAAEQDLVALFEAALQKVTP